MTSGINIKQILTYFFINSNKCSSIICSSFPFCHLFFFSYSGLQSKGATPPQKKQKKKKQKELPQDFHDFHSFGFLLCN